MITTTADRRDLQAGVVPKAITVDAAPLGKLALRCEENALVNSHSILGHVPYSDLAHARSGTLFFTLSPVRWVNLPS